MGKSWSVLQYLPLFLCQISYEKYQKKHVHVTKSVTLIYKQEGFVLFPRKLYIWIHEVFFWQCQYDSRAEKNKNHMLTT